MTTESLDLATWRRIEGYLEEALDLEQASRQAWLESLAQKQPAIALEIGKLLRERDRLDERGFLVESPAHAIHLEDKNSPSLAGSKVGPYLIESLIGRGGMGEVWLASRSDGRFEGRYAVKFLNHTVAQQKLAGRFQQEGRLLGRLTHPNIARLIDAGTSENGKPFLVLEYVGGEPVDRFCDANSFGVEERVRLFLDVVLAVAHAHSRLIVHRDLKPSNVLVTKAGVVKLLDFGIAKLLTANSAQADSTLTRAEDVILTPEYAAPEQLLGEMHTTASDVYQLGMLLFVILTGSHPLIASGSRADRIKAALAGKIPRASDFAPENTGKALRGDLDAILSKALNPDIAQRYPAASALAEDLERYLNREPIIARRGALFYRTRKFVARHRIAVAGSALAVIGLVTTSILALDQAHQARVERDRAVAFSSRSQAVTEFLRKVITEAGDSEKPVTIAEMIARTEKLVLDSERGSAENRAAIMAMLASYYHTWGNQEKALNMDERALALVGNSSDLDLRLQVNCSHALMVGYSGRAKEALGLITSELDKHEPDAGTLAVCYNDLADLANNAGDPATSLRYALQALDQFHKAGMDDPFNEAAVYGSIALAYHHLGKNAESNRYYETALKKYAEAGRDGSLEAIVQRNNWTLVVSGAGEPREALKLYDEIAQMLNARDPSGHPPSGLYHNRARALQLLGRFAQAREDFQTSVRLASEEKNINILGLSFVGLASVADETGNAREAQEYLRKSLASQPKPPPVGGVLATGQTLMQGRLELAAGKFDSALDRLSDILELKRSNVATVDAALAKAETELRMGNPAAAEADARFALDLSVSLQGGVTYSNRTGLSWLMIGRVLRQVGKEEEARSAFESAVVQLSNTVDADHPALIRAHELAAGTLSKGNSRAEINEGLLEQKFSNYRAGDPCEPVDVGERSRKELHAVDG